MTPTTSVIERLEQTITEELLNLAQYEETLEVLELQSILENMLLELNALAFSLWLKPMGYGRAAE